MEQIARRAGGGALDVFRAAAIPVGLIRDQLVFKIRDGETLANAAPDVDFLDAQYFGAGILGVQRQRRIRVIAQRRIDRSQVGAPAQRRHADIVSQTDCRSADNQ
ncbi:hypothetical protein ACFQAT_18710 [Undibacterium arcticum]|uniref:hypothetical protein n=1 Tax=Undibacterium arcticum TaxID=1762892 RepID=UPI0036187063